jgi:hypothetical protein
MRVQGLIECADTPTANDHLVNKQYVDQVVQSAAAGGGGVFFTNIAPTGAGIVGNKQYAPNTIPANKVITEGTADTNNVTVTLVCEGGSAFYSPTITITTVPPLPGTPGTVALAEDANDKRFFTGSFAMTGITEDVVVTATSSTGVTTSTTVRRAVAGPDVTSVTIGALPGSQTEVKSGDVVQVSGVVPNAAAYVEIISGGAAGSLSAQTLGAVDSAGAGLRTFSGTFTVGSGTGAQRVSARARNALGTYGNNVLSGNTVTLNQTYPTIGARTITYPGTQLAIKGTESVAVASTITNADTVVYSSSSDLSVTDPNTYAATKTVTRLAGTSGYVRNVNNYTITATKASNGAVSTAQAQINIADAAATAAITITGNPTRLVGSAAGKTYTVNITPNQVLKSAPTLNASSGTFSGSWTLSGNVWSRTLTITDADADGAQTFSGLSMTGLADVVGSTITSGAAYTVGGFERRTLTFAAFSRTAAIGTVVADFSKVTAKYAGTSGDLTRRTDTTDFIGGFTITDADGNYNPAGGYLYLTDAAFAGSNTTGTLQVEVEEVM